MFTYHGRKEELMANSAVINSIYNYYLTTYAPKTDSKFDTHKKSELRGVYNSIVKMNKEAPLYIVDKSQETKEYAVGLKETARAFHNTIASLGGASEAEMLDKKVAFSTNESLASARYIGEGNGDNVPSFELSVTKLAETQVNEGKFLPSDRKEIPSATYSFDIGINGLNYEFQYNITSEDTNKLVQEKLARLITNADIGLNAKVLEDGKGNSALQIESVNTGARANGHMFNVTDENSSRAHGSVDYFGLDNIVKESSNAEFLIDGTPREAQGNIFTVEKLYEVTLNRVSNGSSDTARIDLQADVESMASNIMELIDGYNSFIDNADKYSENHPKSVRLVNEMASLALLHEEGLSKVGLNIEDDGHITLDKNVLAESVASGGIEDNKNALKAFAGSMLRKADQVSLNPMHYADRTIVAYKNPGHNYASPYVTSAYTGMMFNSYC